MISLQSLSKSYGSHAVLTDINVRFRRGEINGIVGENGAGKTTLFKCIAALESYEGTVDYDQGILKNKLGYLPTDPFFLSKITGKEYLQFVCIARGIGKVNIDESNLFDLPLGEYAENYSTGMKKKLALTGLLLQKNDVFILDEPFNGVDLHSNLIIDEVLSKLKELNKIVVLSSHIFSTLKACDYLHHLKEGKIVTTVSKENFELVEQEMKGGGISSKVIDLLK